LSSADHIESIETNMERAFQKAEKLGEVIGIVSRKTPSKLAQEYGVVVIEVDPATYYRVGTSLSVGDYLIAVDIRTLKAVGLKVVSVSRADIVSEVRSMPAITLEPDVEGLLTSAVLEAAPLLTEDSEPLGMPIEPQSPVVIPTNTDVLARVIGLPSQGLILGGLHTGSSSIAGGRIPMYLPRTEVFKHMMIIGTTGSGKTTFVKNLIYSIHTSWPETMVAVVDAAGDYTQIALPPPNCPEGHEIYVNSCRDLLERVPKWITVLVPIKRGESNLRGFAEKYVIDRVGRLAEVFHGLRPDVKAVVPGRDFGTVNSIIVKVKLGNVYEVVVEVVPISLSYQQLADHLEIFPLFSRQAKVYLRNILNYLESVEGAIINFTHLHRLFQKKFDALRRDLKLHKGTLENIERALNFIAGSEEVDVSIDRRVIGMPPADVLAENYRGPVILDLDYAFLRGAHFLIINMIAYEFMRSMYVWKKVGEGATKPVVLILDEAHRFFPSEGTLPEEVELLADFIARVARLGRARGLGLIFSTHSPRDVHKIVIQLANTKVVFRSRREYLELLDVPKEYYRIIELAPDRVALIESPTIRVGYALFRTSEPLLGHFDLGRVAAGADLKYQG